MFRFPSRAVPGALRLALVLALALVPSAVAQEAGCDQAAKKEAEEEGGGLSPMNVVAVLLLLCLSGLFSGLNLGLMSFAEDDLKVVIAGSQSPREVRDAQTILPLRRRGNLLLCTLLLGNTLVNAILAILLADMTSGLIGSILTTVLIVIFGEIGPQALCSRYALAIGAKAVPIVYFFMFLVFVFAYPISRVLDHLLGAEVSSLYTKQELLSLIALNVEDPLHARDSKMTVADQKLMTGALTFRDKSVDNAMTPLDGVFMIPKSSVLNHAFIQGLLEKGYSRVPVYDDSKPGKCIVSFLYMKDLVGVGFERETPLSEVLGVFDAETRVRRVGCKTSLGEAYDLFQAERLHVLVVTGPAGGSKQAAKAPQAKSPRRSFQSDGEGETKEPQLSGGSCGSISEAADVGLITMEDILEEIVQEEIVDEDDEVVDAAANSKQNNKVVQRNERRYDPSFYIKQLGPGAIGGGLSPIAKGRTTSGSTNSSKKAASPRKNKGTSSGAGNSSVGSSLDP